MGESFDKSEQYISDFLKSLTPYAKIQQLPNFRFRVDINDESVDVRFDRSEMQDFEVALEKFQNTSYFHTLENRIRFHIYVSMGSKGLIPHVPISSELLQEKGEWLKNIRTDVAFNTDFCSVLYDGLKLLSVSIDRTLNSGLMLPEVEAEKRRIDELISFYEQNGHLTSPGAEMGSLSFLKAAAVCVLMEKEKSKRAAELPRIRKAIDRDIYAIVSKIRNDPFRDIKLPEAIHDYVIHQGLASTLKTPKYVREISPDAEQSKLDELLDHLDPRLRKRRLGAWQALRSDNPDRLSQAANSMVELLDQVIGQVCKNVDLATFLTNKYQTHQKTEWVDTTRKWIGKTKDNLHSAKHHVDHQSEDLTKTLLTTAESIILVILE